ncbi:MAG: SPFH domain-containing protein [Promethearchaeota archaeon]
MVKHYKGMPGDYIIKYRGGKIKKAGRGLTFFYTKYKTNIVAIPAVTIDANFIFNELTKNYQSITLQGHYTYIIRDPKKMSLILDYTIDPETNQYLTNDPEKLELRITNIIQMETRTKVESMDLEQSLQVSKDLAIEVLESVKESPLLKEMGVDVLSITFTSIRPTPEIAKALEADYREALARKADEAIYERRAAAVEQEQKIKENELNTQITLEKQKQELIDLEGENIIRKSQYEAKANELQLSPYLNLEPKLVLALALKELALNAEKIGNLTITSEILSQLLNQNS